MLLSPSPPGRAARLSICPSIVLSHREQERAWQQYMSWRWAWTSSLVTQHLWAPDHFTKVIFQPFGVLFINASPNDYPKLLCSQDPLSARPRFSPLLLSKEEPSCPGSYLLETTRGLLDIMLTFSSLCLWETECSCHLLPPPPTWTF